MQLSDIDLIIPHQANSRIIYSAARKLGIAKEKFFVNIDKYANTSAASIPIAISEAIEKNLIKRNSLIAIVGFGAGLTYGGMLLKW